MTDKTDPKLLELLICPISHGRLKFDAEAQELISEKAQLEARKLEE